MTFDGMKRLYVADLDAEEIYRYDSGGTRSTFISSGSGGMEKPYDVTFDSMGNLFVSSEDAEEIYRFASDATPYRFSGDSSSALFSDEDLDSPRGMIITPDDKLLVANERDDNVVQFNPYDGSPTHMPEPDIFASGNGLDGPYDIVIGSAMVQNNAPSIDPIPDKTVSENDSLAVDIVAIDPDNSDSITLSLVSGPPFAVLQDNGDGTGTIALTPNYSHSGTHTVTVSASDGTDSDSASFSVTVYDVNRQPIMESIPDVTIEAGVTGEFVVSATDPDGDTLTFDMVQQNSPPPYITIITNANGTATVTVSPPEDTEPVSVPITISVTGTDTVIMNVGTTKYAVTTGSYDSKTPLSEISHDVGIIDAENILDIFLQLQADLTDSLFSGELEQDIEVNMVC